MTTQPDQTANAPTLLIVDDAPDITQLLVVYFHQGGYKTLTAYDGRTALELAKRANPSLIILDLGLPDQDGLDVCKIIRQTSTVPVIMLTRRNTEADREKGLAVGASAYMIKPFDADELLATVQGLLAH